MDMADDSPVSRYGNRTLGSNASVWWIPDFLENPWRSSTGLTLSLVTCYSAVLAAALLGNVCLIYVIARQKEKANVTNVLIANLSVSDILVCAFCLPFTIVYTLMDYWVFGEVFCKLTPFVQCTSVTVSILSLVMIALERHQLVVHPTGWKPSVPQAYLAVALTWTLACLVSSPFVTFHVLTDEPYRDLPGPSQPLAGKAVCAESWPSRPQRLVYTTWLLVFQYAAPLALVAVCYARIYLRLRRRRDAAMDRASEDDRRLKNSRRINLLLVSLVLAFGLCWLPLSVFNVVVDWELEATPHGHHDLIFSLCHLAAMLSTCVNPVVYGFLNNNFKNELKSILLRCRCSRGGGGGGGGGVGVDQDYYGHFPLSTVSTEVSKTSGRLSCTSNSV